MNTTTSIIDKPNENSFLKTTIDKLFTYYTPKKVIETIEKEKYNFIIGNPKYDNKNI